MALYKDRSDTRGLTPSRVSGRRLVMALVPANGG